MQLNSAHAHSRLGTLGKLEILGSNGQLDFKVDGSARRQPHPLLIMIRQDGELLYSTGLPSNGDSGRSAAFRQRLVEQVLTEIRRPGSGEARASALAQPAPTAKGPERCALVTFEEQSYCLRIFTLQETNGGQSSLYAALVEPIGKSQPEHMNVNKIRDLFRLSKREIDVLGALMSGDTDKEIALKLDVSVETVRAYLKSIRAKLRAKTRTAIVSIIHGVQADRYTRPV